MKDLRKSPPIAQRSLSLRVFLFVAVLVVKSKYVLEVFVQCLDAISVAIGASSHRIRYVFLSSYVIGVPCLISHVFDLLISHLDLSVMLIGILNLECVVLPPQSRRAAIPHDVMASTIFPSDHSFVVITQPLTNIYFLSPLSTDSTIVSYVFFKLRVEIVHNAKVFALKKT